MNAVALAKITSLPVPPDTTVNFFIVMDGTGPADSAPKTLMANRTNLTLLVNERNRGAAFSRNRGFEAGLGEFVLFVDDDVEPNSNLLDAYRAALSQDPLSPGFVGTAQLEPAFNSFTRGMAVSGIPQVWGMAETHSKVAWGVTSNLMVRRDAAKSIRFSPNFPKDGGGEDIDYGLRITSEAGRPFASVPGAIVRHDWWNGGTRQYRRLFRWGYGDSWLGQLHPEHRFYAPPNLVETLALGTVAMAAMAATGLEIPWSVLLWFAAMPSIELIVEVFRLAGRRGLGVMTSIEATLIRLVNDLGRMTGNLRRGRLIGLMERFDYFCTGETIPCELKLATVKLSAFLAGTALVVWAGRFL
jgi:GT2 family glycosyltransferase